MELLSDPFFLAIISVALLSFGYCYIIYHYIAGWQALSTWNLPDSYQPDTRISLLIPARNEEANIPECLRSLSKQDFPKSLLEVIVIDDHSTDPTLDIANRFAREHKWIKVVKLSDHTNAKNIRSFKKKAIELGIEKATGELIVTTDADCVFQPGWLTLLASFYEHNDVKFIAAPVNFHREKNLLERFQSLDFTGMMCLTGAGIHLNWMNMCNGANLAYSKKAFKDVDGFAGIDHLASGDDILLMQKIAARFPGKIGFLKNRAATVFTEAMPDLSSFFSQRLRWATKSTSYREWKITFILSVVFFFCTGIVVSLLLVPFWGLKGIYLFLGLLLVKAVADFYFLTVATRFFGRRDLMNSFITAQFLHILYIVVVGTLGNIKKKYRWKDRDVV